MFQSINPYTGAIISTYLFTNKQSKEALIESVALSQSEWKRLSIGQRGALLKSVAKKTEAYLEEAAQLITQEMGKPIVQSRLEVKKCIDLCIYYAENGEDILSDKHVLSANEAYVTYEPLGVILGIMPWNFPFWQVFRFVIPTLLAGNTVIIKHALNVPECALLIEKIINESISEFNVYGNLFLDDKNTEQLIAHSKIKGVSLTGGTEAGKIIAIKAGETLKPVTLELGGSNALIVFKDADIHFTVEECVKARFLNNGQSCIAGKRLLVHKSIKKEFIQKLIQRVNELKIGDPKKDATDISVLAKRELLQTLKCQLSESVKQGAKILLGGSCDTDCFFEPTLISNVTPTMPLFFQETFGPVLAIISFENEKEAVSLANATEFGLGVSLFSKDVERMKTLIPYFDDGAVFINSLVKSIANLPFGGNKTSGLGRELAEEGAKAFTNTKTVFIGN